MNLKELHEQRAKLDREIKDREAELVALSYQNMRQDLGSECHLGSLAENAAKLGLVLTTTKDHLKVFVVKRDADWDEVVGTAVWASSPEEAEKAARDAWGSKYGDQSWIHSPVQVTESTVGIILTDFKNG